MEDEQKLNELEDENRRMRERLSYLEEKIARQQTRRSRLALLIIRTFAGRPLYKSVNQMVDELAERRIARDTIKEVTYATLHRLTRVGMVALLIALGPLLLAGLQTYYLKKQNEKLDIQNDRIEQQTFLQEAERRSSLVFLFDNVLDKIDEELRMNPGRRALSPQLVGRIVALTKALKPYRYLEGDTITSYMSSPERGQVLLSLLASQLHPSTYDQIFLLADFSYTSLQSANLDGAYLRNINLSNAFLESVSLTGTDLRYANLENADIRDVRVQMSGAQARPACFDHANFHSTSIINCDFGSSSFEYANFSKARLQRVSFRGSFFNQTKFAEVQADTLDFGEATMLNTTFSLANGKKDSSSLFQWTNVHLDTASYRQITRLPIYGLPVLDTSRQEFRIKRDTFYLDDKKPIVVEDSVELFGTFQR